MATFKSTCPGSESEDQTLGHYLITSMAQVTAEIMACLPAVTMTLYLKGYVSENEMIPFFLTSG